jgi:hypothetical protein
LRRALVLIAAAIGVFTVGALWARSAQQCVPGRFTAVGLLTGAGLVFLGCCVL